MARKKAKAKAKEVHKTWGMSTCDSKDSLYDREYATKLGLQRLDFEIVQVKIASSYIPESYGLNLQNIFIEQIADMFRLAVLDDKNCHGFNTKAMSCVFCIPHTCVAKVGPEKGHKLDQKGWTGWQGGGAYEGRGQDHLSG